MNEGNDAEMSDFIKNTNKNSHTKELLKIFTSSTMDFLDTFKETSQNSNSKTVKILYSR